jgi:excinuclease ABC subunit A
MSNRNASRAIRVRGARQNNLKNLSLDLPLGELIVVTGLSGSGKSSLAFDTLFAEGQRRYVETFSPYARQFLDRMDKPRVDRIENIPPAIAVEQRNSVRSTRSTVGTMTELTEFAKLVWLHLAQLHCRQCGRPVRMDHPRAVWEGLMRKERPQGRGDESVEVLVLFDVPLSEKLALGETLEILGRQGYQRLLLDGEVVRTEEAAQKLGGRTPAVFRVLQDRLKLQEPSRRRFLDACEQACHFGKGRFAVYFPGRKAERRFSNRLHCAECNLDYKEPVPALFSFNHPLGACPACKGFGRTITIDYNLAIPDRTKTLAEGAVKPWQTETGSESQRDLEKFCRRGGIPMGVPFARLPAAFQKLVIEGEADYGTDPAHEWPPAWYGLKGYFRWLETKAYKMHVRVLLSRYRAYVPCAACHGERFQPESLLYLLPDASGRPLNLSQFYALSVERASALVAAWMEPRRPLPVSDPLKLALGEMLARLRFLEQAGLGYLTLDRATRTLSGGETERVSLTTCLGTRLVNTLFVLDEPSVGLHARDTDRLIRVLQELRDAGNTVVVVEHDARIIRAADRVLDLGPGHGESGGHLVFEGSFDGLLRERRSLTGRYLRGEGLFPASRNRPVSLEGGAEGAANWHGALTLANARAHNLKNPRIRIPLKRLVCVTGVSGSGKTTLIKRELLPLLRDQLQAASLAAVPGEAREETREEPPEAAASAATLSGAGQLSAQTMVDQSPLGRTPRSTPALYVGAFDSIRDLFARTPDARKIGLPAGAFSFNSRLGQCGCCHGAGFEKIEMQFLSDVFIRCPDCNGKRYQPGMLEIKLTAPGRTGKGWSIAELLEATVDEGLDFLRDLVNGATPSKRADAAASDAQARLRRLQEVGLGYLRLGQPINTLSGGECQRLKLAKHLAESPAAAGETSTPTLFMFDEPTTGLHFDDVRVLLEVFQKLVGAGHSVLIIEHNLDVIRAADWVIDLGPGGGEAGGELVAAGPPEAIAACAASQTGAALRADAAHRPSPVAAKAKVPRATSKKPPKAPGGLRSSHA